MAEECLIIGCLAIIILLMYKDIPLLVCPRRFDVISMAYTYDGYSLPRDEISGCLRYCMTCRVR
jgi:hypothetical protein